MIGPLLLLVTWVLLRVEGKSLASLGIDRPTQRLREFAFFVAVSGTAAALQQVGYAVAADTSWILHPNVSGATVTETLRFTTNSVLYEEFVFRGYLLFQARRFFGPSRAVVLDAVAFGIYHWFSFGVFGNPVAMVYVFLLTGGFGAMCATAFATKGIVAPIGLHFGWNFVTYAVFSAGPSGRVLLIPANGDARIRVDGAAGVLLGFAFPLLFVVATTLFLARKSRHPSNAKPEHPIETHPARAETSRSQ